MLQSAFAELSIALAPAIGAWAAWAANFAFYRRARSRYANTGDRLSARPRALHDADQGVALLPMVAYNLAMIALFIQAFACFSGGLLFKQLVLEPLGLSLVLLSYAFMATILCVLRPCLLLGPSLGGSADFSTALWQTLAIGPVALLCNNLLSFFFLLEVLSASTMFMLLASRESFCLPKARGFSPRHFFSVAFFQFWSSFFSSALLVFAIVTLSASFGTTEWSMLDILVEAALSRSTGPVQHSVYLSLYTAVFGALVKLGASPFFFFKLEVYKGLPAVPLVFYSLLYFTVFVLLFSLTFAYYLKSALVATLPGLCLYIVCSTLLLVSNIFSFPALRSFFALSSLLSLTTVLFLLLSLGH